MHHAMAALGNLVRFELAALVTCFALTVMWKILRGILRPGGMTAFRKKVGDGIAGLLRLQMLAASAVVAVFYLASAPQAAASGALPPVPKQVLLFLAGSQAIFLGAAAWRTLRAFSILRNEGEK